MSLMDVLQIIAMELAPLISVFQALFIVVMAGIAVIAVTLVITRAWLPRIQ